MKNIVLKIVFLIALCVFLYSGFNLGYTYYKYWKVDHDNDVLVKEVVKKEKKHKASNVRKIDFNYLRRLNKDIVGWLYIKDVADYPILKGQSNDTYLHHNYKKNYSFAGSIFLDEISNKNFQDRNTIIYGHNMNNGSMFGQLKKFSEQSFMNNHPVAYIYLPDGSVNVYDIFSFNRLDATDTNYYRNNIEYGSFIKKLVSASLANRQVSTKKAPLIMLSTCATHDTNWRSVVFARLSKTIHKG